MLKAKKEKYNLHIYKISQIDVRGSAHRVLSKFFHFLHFSANKKRVEQKKTTKEIDRTAKCQIQTKDYQSIL